MFKKPGIQFECALCLLCTLKVTPGSILIMAKTTYNYFVFISSVICLCGFIYNTHETFDKFINSATLVLREAQSHQCLPLPTFVLCNDTAYKEIPSLQRFPIWQEDTYLELTRNPLEMLVSIEERNNTGLRRINYTEENLNTVSHGRCQVIHIHQPVSQILRN